MDPHDGGGYKDGAEFAGQAVQAGDGRQPAEHGEVCEEN